MIEEGFKALKDNSIDSKECSPYQIVIMEVACIICDAAHAFICCII